MQSYRTLLTIFVAVFVLLGYQFIGATWSAPTVPPTAGNVLPPINVGTSTQVKDGNLNARIFQAATAVWSNSYCDILGQNCFTPTNPGRLPACANGQVLVANGAGGWSCSNFPTPPPPAQTCRYETINVVGCVSAPGCPAGYTAIGLADREPAGCPSSRDRFTQACGRNVCS